MSLEFELSVVVLAAGEGTRMHGDLPKVLYPLCGRPMVHYVLDAAMALNPQKVVLVIGHKGEEVRDNIQSRWPRQNAEVDFAWQHQQKGTGHAVMCAKEALLDGDPDVLVLYGDTPLLTGDTLLAFAKAHKEKGAHLSLITTVLKDPAAYGRVVRDPRGNVSRIAEARDLTPDESHIYEVNAGIYMARASLLFDLLSRVGNHNAKGEYYLTDIVSLASASGHKVVAFVCEDEGVVQGINDRWALAQAEETKRRALLKDLALSGVTVRDPSSTYVDSGVTVGPDTTLEPHTYLRGSTTIGPKCSIGPGTEILNSKIGGGSRVWMSVIEDSVIEDGVQIGPFSHLRPNSLIKTGALVGNFAEVKNSEVGLGTKIHHHSYIGDTDLGQGVNIGAGTVTVNYDGKHKHRTTIQDGAFVGCNANLIAPVTIGEGSYVAAGSTITHDVPQDALAIARERQVVKEGWVSRRSKDNGQGRNQ